MGMANAIFMCKSSLEKKSYLLCSSSVHIPWPFSPITMIEITTTLFLEISARCHYLIKKSENPRNYFFRWGWAFLLVTSGTKYGTLFFPAAVIAACADWVTVKVMLVYCYESRDEMPSSPVRYVASIHPHTSLVGHPSCSLTNPPPLLTRDGRLGGDEGEGGEVIPPHESHPPHIIFFLFFFFLNWVLYHIHLLTLTFTSVSQN